MFNVSAKCLCLPCSRDSMCSNKQRFLCNSIRISLWSPEAEASFKCNERNILSWVKVRVPSLHHMTSVPQTHWSKSLRWCVVILLWTTALLWSLKHACETILVYHYMTTRTLLDSDVKFFSDTNRFKRILCFTSGYMDRSTHTQWRSWAVRDPHAWSMHLPHQYICAQSYCYQPAALHQLQHHHPRLLRRWRPCRRLHWEPSNAGNYITHNPRRSAITVSSGNQWVFPGCFMATPIKAEWAQFKVTNSFYIYIFYLSFLTHI